jgi:hypothetical protein
MKKQILSEEFRRMQKLAGLIKEDQENNIDSLDINNPNIINDINEIKENFKKRFDFTNPIYKGLSEYLEDKSFQLELEAIHDQVIEILFDTYNDDDNEVRDNWEGKYKDEWSTEFEKNMGVFVLDGYSDQYINNLFNNGFKYDPNTDKWEIPDNQKGNFFNTHTANIIEAFDTSDGTFFERMEQNFYNALEDFLQD